MKSLGHHLIAEFYECDVALLNDTGQIKAVLLEAVQRSGAQIIAPIFHKFAPHGVSGVVVIAESHFSIHTWPEYGYCAVDIFTCSDLTDNETALRYLKQALNAQSLSVVEMKRGILDLPSDQIRHKPEE